NEGPSGRLVLFGGQTPIPGESGLRDDTWVFNGQRWTQLHPPVSPSARQHAAAAYDAPNQTVVLFGGFAGNAAVGDTWTWDGIAWREQHPAHSPSARFGARLAY